MWSRSPEQVAHSWPERDQEVMACLRTREREEPWPSATISPAARASARVNRRSKNAVHVCPKACRFIFFPNSFVRFSNYISRYSH